MRRRLLWINAGLLLTAVAVGGVVRRQWRDYSRAHPAPKVRVEAPAAPSQPPEPEPAPGMSLPQAGNYNPIFERNLFSPNRVEFEPADPVAAAPAVPPMPGMPILNGLSVIGDKKVAFIQEPRPGAQPQSRAVQVGDTIMNFGKIKEIRADALVFTWGDQTQVLEMLNNDGPRARTAIGSRLQTTVITVGGGRRTSPATSGTAAAGAAPVIGASAVPTIQIGVLGVGNSAAGAAAGVRQNVAQNQQQNQPQSVTQQQDQNQNQNQNYIDTPFGRVARPARRTN